MKPVIPLVLAALFVCAAQPSAAQQGKVRPALQKQIHRALDRGRAFLTQRAVGGRTSRSRTAADTQEGGLLLYAALHAGVHRDEPWMQAALRDLSRTRQPGTYLAACAILALAKADSEAYGKKIQSLADQLVRWQDRNGAWGYPSGEDLSNTQYAALGLWTAARAGANVKPMVWARLTDALPHFTGPYGGFSYRRGGTEPTLSMTAAGCACASICLSVLEATPEGAKLVAADGRARSLHLMEARALEWMADHFEPGQNPGRSDSHAWWLYTLYGVERAAALAGVERLGSHDWYAEGALHLVGSQQADGSWNAASGTVAATSFAVLFLQRATAKTTELVVSGPRRAAPGRSDESLSRERLWRRDLGRNRMEHSGPTLAASSEADGHGAALAIDGTGATWWQSGSDDSVPSLSFGFETPHSIDTIVISHPMVKKPRSGDDPLEFTLAREVLVVVNDSKVQVFTMPADSLEKARLELADPVDLERLELRFRRAPRVDGGEAVLPIGVGEVEIQLRPK